MERLLTGGDTEWPNSDRRNTRPCNTTSPPVMLPEETLPLRVARDHVPYDRWEQQGYLQTTEGKVVHYGYIERFMDALGQKFHIKEIAYDRWGDSPQCGEMSRRDKRDGQ